MKAGTKAHLATRAEAEEPLSVQLRRFCSHMKDTEIAKLTKAAQSARNGSWSSHTARYRGDPTYRTQMRDRTPAVPEWLVYSGGEVARLDGRPGTEYP